MLLLDKPSAETFQESDDVRYCHTVCIHCADGITLCGAYKPKLCNVLPVFAKNAKCPACNKLLCPDCQEQVGVGCSRCGG